MRWRTPGAPRRSDVPRGPQRAAAAGFSVSLLGSAGFVVAYLLDSPVWWQGAGLAAAFAGLSVGLAAWALLLPQGPYVEAREPMLPPPAERRALAEELGHADGSIVSSPLPRRVLTAAIGALGIAALVPLRSLLSNAPPPSEALYDNGWGDGVPLTREDGTAVRVADLRFGSALTAFPRGREQDGDAAVLVLRLAPRDLALPGGLDEAAAVGVVAYSKICTHAGCPVGLFAEGTGELLCPCHQSVFDVYRGAVPRYGPAARPLPRLPLRLAADGGLVAAGDFPTPPGPGFWRRPS